MDRHTAAQAAYGAVASMLANAGSNKQATALVAAACRGLVQGPQQCAEPIADMQEIVGLLGAESVPAALRDL
eukprot:779956-Prorocentrum_lima.AAC.1